MADLKLFQIGQTPREIQGSSVALEKHLQTTIERNLETFFSIRFLASEHETGRAHGGRIDTLGIDENGCPVIIEYKRAVKENVINQGLFYLNWLLDHRAEFELLVLRKLGQQVADSIDWLAPRLLCIAGDFTKYDEHAVQQINRNIELIRYKRFGSDLLLFELVNATTASHPPEESGASTKTVSEYLAEAPDELAQLYENAKVFLLSLGDDVQMKTLKNYFAFRRMRNFACVEVHPKSKTLLIYVKVDPDSINLEEGFTRDVRKIGHFGTGDLEIRVCNSQDLERAKPLLDQSYEAS
jgi:predicted transport protein